MSTPVDLRQLAVDRSEPHRAELKQRRNWLTRYVFPGLIVCGFVAVTGWSLRDRLLPATPVTILPVVMAKADVQQSGTPLFQAAGWIEPRPSPVLASALVEGVVESMLVVEGQAVRAGDPLATLVAADAKLALREAEIALKLRKAELDQSKAILKATAQTLAQPVQIEAALAAAEAAHAASDLELKNIPFLLRSAKARLTFAEQDLQGKQSLGDSIAGRMTQKAQSEFDSAAAAVDELKQRADSLKTQHESTQRQCDALRRRLELKTEETRAHDEAVAAVAAMEAKVEQATLAVETAQLRLERMTIRSPIAGRVLAINAQPGARLMGLNAASQRDSSTVVSLYDPEQLQVRADVRLEDLPQVQPGQRVQISTASIKEPLWGHVLTATSTADIQKNTLSVKVAIDNPPAVIKPEMLAQVTFLAPELPQSTASTETSPLRLLVPRELVDSAAGGSSVWIADTTAHAARRRQVQLGSAGTQHLVEVTQGISALDKLIVSGRESLQDGQRIRVTGEDTTLGRRDVASATPGAAPTK